ncbi:VOC family protein [Phenylobacterium montanum]|uniref:VOC family protein n=1 Tax=Phenylobacterium montanum TaxID=2823693 RepID=A0A975ISZ5_9CAUL|nr:VOC family protein [Caulobacter sp. S6]QUD86327.1 VOC family protein [Caulobacter sp. S6]
MLDHITFGVADFERATAFYDKALAPLGVSRVMQFDEGAARVVGYGEGTKPYFWLQNAAATQGPLHVAFAAADRAAVDAFYAAALAAGGIDNGAPGVRAHYHPSYYGAFVLDPEGRNIEAVCHTP